MNPSLLQPLIYRAEQSGLVQRTFRRLDPSRQSAVVEAILNETAEVGPENIRVQQIASNAGVSTGSMYQYFQDRECLQAFAINLCKESWLDLFNQYLPQLAELPLREGLRAYLWGGLELGKSDQGVVQFFGRTAYQNSKGKFVNIVEDLSKKMLESVKKMLENAQARKEIRADIDLEVTSRLIHTMMIALGDSQLFPYLNQYYRLTDEQVQFDQIIENALDLIFSGLSKESLD